MSEAFRSSDDFDEQAHQLYNEGRYDDALVLLREGLAWYPNAAELHVGLAYAHLAREEYPWARRAFEQALGLDPNHEDALAGYGEVLLKVGDRGGAMKSFERVLQLGFEEDHDLMLQIGRSLFREGLVGPAQRYFELAATAHPESPDATACMGYAAHRLGDDGGALYWLRRALALEPKYPEARIYLANMLYDRGESDAALYQLERTGPDDHYDELALWRLIELKKSIYRLPDDDPELIPWFSRLSEITGDSDSIDLLLAEVEAQATDGTPRDPNQLDLFGTLLTELHAMQQHRRLPGGDAHLVATLSGELIRGTWDEILLQMKAAEGSWAAAPMAEFMADLARRGHAETGVIIPMTDAEAFLKGSAAAGVVRIIQ